MPHLLGLMLLMTFSQDFLPIFCNSNVSTHMNRLKQYHELDCFREDICINDRILQVCIVNAILAIGNPQNIAIVYENTPK